MQKKLAIEKIKKQIIQINLLKELNYNDSQIKQWKRETQILIENVFGNNERQLKEFASLRFTLGIFQADTPNHYFQEV